MEMRDRFLREVAKTGLPQGPGKSDPVTPAALAALPEPVRRYFAFMGVLGRPRDWSFRVSFDGRFRLKSDKRFRSCDAWLYTCGLAVARIFHMRMRMGGVVPMLGRDTYLGGRGRMVIRVLDLYTVEDGKGAEYDTSELVSYLNDAVLIAPSMLLVPAVAWSAADANSFTVTLTDKGRTVSARVLIDARGAPREFTTTDRYCYDPDDPRHFVHARWTTPVEGWQQVEGRQVPVRIEARWHLQQGLFTYAEFSLKPGTLAFNVPPGA